MQVASEVSAAKSPYVSDKGSRVSLSIYSNSGEKRRKRGETLGLFSRHRA